MLAYFLISVLVDYQNVEAAPSLLHRADTPQSSSQRTLFGIIWSCFSTIIICAWTSVHPNVPPPNQWKARWNRLKLMFWMIIAPELVLAWVVRQFFAAREIRDTYNAEHPGFAMRKMWTLRHGHLLEMGGFRLIDSDQKDANEQHGIVLTVDYFNEHPDLDFPELTSADIDDRSKGDALTKIIAILQTTWFIIQCVARGEQGLALTELELVTLALASLNAVTFAIWWHKPLGVQEPVRIYLKTEALRVESARQEKSPPPRDDGISFRDFRAFYRNGWDRVKIIARNIFPGLKHPFKEGFMGFTAIFLLLILLPLVITFPFFDLFPIGTIFLLRIIKTDPVPPETPQRRGLIAAQIVASLQRFRYRLTSVVSKFVGSRLANTFADVNEGSEVFTVVFFGWFILLPLLFFFLSLFVLFFLPIFALIFLVSLIFTAVFGIVTTTAIKPGASHVPSFYAPPTSSDSWSRMVVFAVFGMTFGGLHCIGWNFKFPIDLEQTLWRATSLAITVIPLIVAPIDFLLTARDVNSCANFERVSLLALDLVMTVLLFMYVPARLFLIAQALALLRGQPTGALAAVDWTKYLPHLFSS